MVTLRVTIKNNGPRALFIDRDISALNERFTLYIHHGSKMEGSLLHVTEDFLMDRTSPFATLLYENFTVLGPGMFYGGDVVMDPREYPRLRVPGRYLVKGEYSSRGFNAPGEGNPLRGRSEEVRSLPFAAWEGRVRTNAVWITVSRSAK
jgi:hypothetical protein